MSVEREYVDNKFATKGTANGGLVTGIVGTGAGVLALATQALEAWNKGDHSRANQCAAQANMPLMELLMLVCAGNMFQPHAPAAPAAPIAPVAAPVYAAPAAYAAPAMGYGCPEQIPATRYDLDNLSRNASKDAEKDAKIARLEADQRTDGKILELYRYVDGKFGDVEKAMNHQREYVAEEFKQVQIYQATNTQAIKGLAKQNQDLSRAFNSLTELYIPQRHVSPTQPVNVILANSENNPLYTEDAD